MLQTSLKDSSILWLVLKLPPTHYSLCASWFHMPFPTPRDFAPNKTTNCITSNESSLLKWQKSHRFYVNRKYVKRLSSACPHHETMRIGEVDV